MCHCSNHIWLPRGPLYDTNCKRNNQRRGQRISPCALSDFPLHSFGSQTVNPTLRSRLFWFQKPDVRPKCGFRALFPAARSRAAGRRREQKNKEYRFSRTRVLDQSLWHLLWSSVKPHKLRPDFVSLCLLACISVRGCWYVTVICVWTSLFMSWCASDWWWENTVPMCHVFVWYSISKLTILKNNLTLNPLLVLVYYMYKHFIILSADFGRRNLWNLPKA